MAEIIKKGKIKRKNGENVEVLLPYTTEDQVDGLVSDLAGKIANPSTKVEGNFLKYDGTTWVAANVPESGVLSVSAVADSGISVDNTDAANPKVGIASTHKLPTTTEWAAKVDNTIKVNGHALSSDVTVTKADVELGNVVNTGDSATPVEGGTTKFTTGGAYTELAKKVDKVSTANKVYGTDASGNQTTYDKDAFSKVDDVKVDGTSVVTDKVANIDLTGKVDKTQTINGKALSGNITLYGSDIAADSGTATKLIDTTTHKIPESLLPDSVLGQMILGGSVEKSGESILAYPSARLKSKLGISDDTIQLVNSATDDTTATPKKYGYKTLEGVYFLARNDFDIVVGTETVHFGVGDWLIGAGTYWDKIDNTDAVTGVKGNNETEYRIGNVNLTCDNIGAEPAFTDGSAKVADITSDVMSIYGVTQSGGAIGNGSKVGEVYTKGKVDTLLGGYVPTGRKVNGHALTEDISVTATDIGLSVSASDGVTLNSVTYKYTHPSYTAAAEGLYKVTVDALGHISKTTAVAKSDLTGLGVADDSLVVHLAGAETITGKKTFSGDVELPENVKINNLTSTGLVKYTNGKLSVDTNTYLTEAVTSITAGAGLTGGTITSTGTIALATTGVTAGTYSAVSVDTYGRVTAGGQMLDVISYGTTPNVVDGGWYFEENQA